jgi:hypothetical protein
MTPAVPRSGPNARFQRMAPAGKAPKNAALIGSVPRNATAEATRASFPHSASQRVGERERAFCGLAAKAAIRKKVAP